MTVIEQTNNLSRDLEGLRSQEQTAAPEEIVRKLSLTPRYRDIDRLLSKIVELLANDKPLPASNRHHSLTGEWVGLRDCHVRPDLLLIYDKPHPQLLILNRLGSHSELFK